MRCCGCGAWSVVQGGFLVTVTTIEQLCFCSVEWFVFLISTCFYLFMCFLFCYNDEKRFEELERAAEPDRGEDVSDIVSEENRKRKRKMEKKEKEKEKGKRYKDSFKF
ncbi:unnamed protein product [Choristocarpus tenellus]